MKKFLLFLALSVISTLTLAGLVDPVVVEAEVSFLDKLLGWFDSLPAHIVMITSLVTAASAFTALTPTTADDKIVAGILRVLNWLSLNVFKNKNADDKPTE